MSDNTEENVEVVPEIIYLTYDNDDQNKICYSTIEIHQETDNGMTQKVNEVTCETPTVEENVEITTEEADSACYAPLFVYVDVNNDSTDNATLIDSNEISREIYVKGMHFDQVTNSDKNEIYYSCRLCQKVYRCSNCVNLHYETVHLQWENPTYLCKASTKCIDKDYICTVCDLLFCNEFDMKSHRKSHDLICSICGATFETASMLQKHQIAHGTILQCQKCPCTYMQENKLVAHYKVFHNLQKCVKCNLLFSDELELKEHFRQLHSGDLAGEDGKILMPYACNKCNKEFAAINEVAKHLRTNHPNKFFTRNGKGANKAADLEAPVKRKRRKT